MKNWHKLAASAAIVAAFSINAQNVDQRKSIRQTLEAAELGTLAEKYQRQFEADEAKVREYLLANPTVQRDEVKHGKVHHIVPIDADGNPVFRVARDIADPSGSQKNRASGQLIKVDSLYPGGSIGVNIRGTGMLAGV